MWQIVARIYVLVRLCDMPYRLRHPPQENQFVRVSQGVWAGVGQGLGLGGFAMAGPAKVAGFAAKGP